MPASFHHPALLGRRATGPWALLRRRLSLLVLLAGLCLARAVAVAAAGPPVPMGEGPLEEQRAVGALLPLESLKPYAPGSATAPPKLGGARLSAAGPRLYVVHLWASWCGPCREEFPYLRQLFRKGKYQEAQLISVAVQSPDAELGEFLAKEKDNLPEAPIYLDDSGATLRALKLNKLPLTLLVDRQWRVRQVFSGPIHRRRQELLMSMDNFITPPNLNAVALASDIKKCPSPPCLNPGFFMHRSLLIDDVQRWNSRNNNFAKLKLELPLKSRPNLLYLFSPNCIRCADDIQHLQRIADGWGRSKARQASIVLVSLSSQTDCSRTFLSEQEVSYRNVDVLHTPSKNLAQYIEALDGPLILIMNRLGYVRNAYVGLLAPQRVAVTQALIAATQGG